MKRALLTIACLATLQAAASAQTPPAQDSLLDRMAGHWVLQGVIAGMQTTHDVDIDWVLKRGYLQLHEVSREQEPNGTPQYEAIVFITKDKPAGYACLWLDNTAAGPFAADGVGHGNVVGDSIPFLFKGSDGSLFHTTFVYNPRDDTWQWLMDGESAGKREPFARVTLTRKGK